MKKQWNKNLFRTVLLLMSVVLMLSAGIAGIVANAAPTVFTLSVTFDATVNANLLSCTVTIRENNSTEWGAPQPVNSGDVISINQNSEVKLTVTTKSGKWPVFDVAGGTFLTSPSKNYVQWATFNDNSSVTVSCIEQVCSIVAWDYDRQPVDFYGDNGEEEMPQYTLAADSGFIIDQLFDKSIKYQYGAEPLTELPAVVKEDYVYNGWYVITGDSTETDYHLGLDENGKCYIENGLVFGNKKVINVYPDLTPVKYDVYREDWIYNPLTGDKDEKLAGAIKKEEVDADYLLSAIEKNFWPDDPADGYYRYKGYLLKEDYNYPTHSVGNPLDNTYYNLVYRYFEPIVYELVYMDEDGTLFESGEYAPEYVSYTYSNPTAINAPTRKGYTFTGWTVQVYNASSTADDKWETVPGGLTGVDFTLGDRASGYDSVTGERYDYNAVYASDAQIGENGEEIYQIRLIANWNPNTYKITYDWGNIPDELQDMMDGLPQNALLKNDYKEFLFDRPADNPILAIPAPFRPGYTFTGWTLTDEDGNLIEDELTFENGVLILPTDQYDFNLILTAKEWEKESYTVIFDGAGATTPPDASVSTTVRYDEPFSLGTNDLAAIIPVRTGYTFKGYYSEPNGQGTQFINVVNGEATLTNAIWNIDGEDGGTVTLYAHWEINEYEISINVDGITDPDALDGVTITIIPAEGDEFTVGINESFWLPYQMQFDVRIAVAGEYKIVSFSGDAGFPGHSRDYTCENLTVDAWDAGLMTFTATVLPMRALALTQSNVNYPNEKLQNLSAGKYIVYNAGGEELATFRINSQSLTYDISRWIGTESTFIQIVYCGENGFSDSDPVTLELKGRPKAPEWVSDGVGEIESIDFKTYSIIINMTTSAKSWYEYACVEVGSGAVPEYSPKFEFTELKPGTRYTIYIRKAATDSEPHGIDYVFAALTDTDEYFNAVKDELEQLKGENPGPITSDLIDQAIAEIEKLGENTPENYYQTVQTIIQTIKEKELQIAIAKDRAIQDLTDLRDEALQSDSFTDEKIAELEKLFADAVASITASATEEEVKTYYNSAVIAMKNVPIHRLTDADRLIFLQSLLGLDQESLLTLIRDVDFETLSRAVQEAIRTSGKVAVGSFMTQEEAENLLRSLEVVASYRFEMSNSDKVREGDVFTIRLTIPENLRSMTGLQVAYYDDATGVLELLESRVEGDALVFTTKRIADFVILADPTIDLTGIMIALGAILLCQIVAIAFILVSRVNSKKTVTHASVAFPAVFLTVHFLPVNGELITLIMAGAVVVLQIVLMALLLSSGVVHLPKKKKNAPTEEVEEGNTSPYAEIYPDKAYANESVQDSFEETLADSASDDNADVEADFGTAAILMGTDEMSDEDPFIMYREDGDGEHYDEESFIEPAATTRYSLPDDEFAAYDSEESADGEDAEYADVAEDDERLYYDENAYGETVGMDENAEAVEEVYANDAIYADEEAYAEESLYAEEAYDNNEAYGDYPYETEETVDEEDTQASEEELLQDETYFAPAEEESDDTDPLYRYDE